MLRSLSGIPAAIIISVYIVFAIWASNAVLDNNTHIYAENGLIENIQAAILAIACLVYLLSATLNKKTETLIFLFFSLLCYSFMLRELDVERLDVPHVLKVIGSGKGRDISLALAFSTIFIYAALTDFSYYKKAAIDFIRSRPGVLMMAAAVFLLIGDIFEKYKDLAYHDFFEEMSELFAYGLILSASFTASFFPNNLNTAS